MFYMYELESEQSRLNQIYFFYKLLTDYFYNVL